MTRADKFLTAALLFAAILATAALFCRTAVSSNKALSTRAVISVQGKVVRAVDLSSGGEKMTFTVTGREGAARVEVAGNRVRMVEAPCARHICVARGWIEKPGESIVCIPGEILIRIDGAAPVDAVTK